MSSGQGRVERLTGLNGSQGGGLPLPDVFRTVIRYLLEHEDTPTWMITGVIQKAIGLLQEKRVLSIWRNWDAFTEDILEQLTVARIVIHGDSGWRVSPDFIPMRRYVVIPETGTWIITGRKEDEKKNNTIAETNRTIIRLRKQLVDAEVMTPELEKALEDILDALNSFSREIFIPKRRKSQDVPDTADCSNWHGYLSFPPDDPPDAPPVQCWGQCRRFKHRDISNFEVYYSSGSGKTGGYYYWRRACRVCHREAAVLRREKRRERVKAVVQEIAAEGGMLTLREITARVSANESDVYRDIIWLRRRYEDIPEVEGVQGGRLELKQMKKN